MSANENVIRELAAARFINHYQWGSFISGGLSFEVNALAGTEPWGEVVSASDTITVTIPQGLSSLLGKYNDDPSWDGFSDFLEEYRREIDRANE